MERLILITNCRNLSLKVQHRPAANEASSSLMRGFIYEISLLCPWATQEKLPMLEWNWKAHAEKLPRTCWIMDWIVCYFWNIVLTMYQNNRAIKCGSASCTTNTFLPYQWGSKTQNFKLGRVFSNYLLACKVIEILLHCNRQQALGKWDLYPRLQKN